MTAATAPLRERRLGANGVLLLPERPPRLGPVSRKLVVRLVTVLALLVVIGTAMLVLSTSEPVRAAGLSLVFPGGGLLYIA